MIRFARRDDLPALQEVERAAGALFREIGMDSVANHDPMPVADLTVDAKEGRAWVSTTDGDRPVAHLLVAVVDSGADIEQVSVHPRHAHRGLGRGLLDTAEIWAAARGLPWLTLTTYAEVPWNAPYYERLGFEIVHDGGMGSGLRMICGHEAAKGLAEWRRVTMRKRVRCAVPPE